MTLDTASVQHAAAAMMRSPRLRLRAVTEDELELLDQWWNNPETLPLQESGVLPRPSGSRIDTFRQWHTNASPASVGLGVERIADGLFLGSVVLYGATLQSPSATFAIQLRPDLLGQGYGTEAVRLAVDHGFRSLPLHRIELRVHAYNSRAIACYRRAGFVEEGVRREVTWFDGAWHDEVCMAILRSEWRPSDTH